MTDAFTVSPHSKEFGSSPRWVRVYFNNQAIAESKKMMLLREANHLPLYYFPKHDVRMDCLQPSDHTTDSGRKGEGVFWHVKVGDKIAMDAAFTFRNAAQRPEIGRLYRVRMEQDGCLVRGGRGGFCLCARPA